MSTRKTFKEYRNEENKVNEAIINTVPEYDYSQDFIKQSMCAVSALHMNHLLTKDATKHDVIGEIYASVLGFTDQLAEIYLGTGGKIDEEYECIFTPTGDSMFAEKILVSLREGIKNQLMKEEDGLESFHEILEQYRIMIDKSLYKLDMK